ncbi:MAG: hypothetical protein AAB731_02155 [Patescibacteria group bacterium]
MKNVLYIFTIFFALGCANTLPTAATPKSAETAPAAKSEPTPPETTPAEPTPAQRDASLATEIGVLVRKIAAMNLVCIAEIQSKESQKDPARLDKALEACAEIYYKMIGEADRLLARATNPEQVHALKLMRTHVMKLSHFLTGLRGCVATRADKKAYEECVKKVIEQTEKLGQ